MPVHVLWKGRPSHWLYWKTYAACILFCGLIAPLAYAAWQFRRVRLTTYQVSTTGASITLAHDPTHNRLIELSRIKSVEIVRGGYPDSRVSDLVIHHQKPSIPPLIVRAVRNAPELRERIETAIGEFHRRRPVHEISLPILPR